MIPSELSHRSALDRWKDLADKPYFVPMVAFDLVVLAVVQELPGVSRDLLLPTHSPPTVLDELADVATAVRRAIASPRKRSNIHTLAPLLARECPYPEVGVPLPDVWPHVARYLMSFQWEVDKRSETALGRKLSAKIREGRLLIAPPAGTCRGEVCSLLWGDIFSMGSDDFATLVSINSCKPYSAYPEIQGAGDVGPGLCLGPLALCLTACAEHGGSCTPHHDEHALRGAETRWLLRVPDPPPRPFPLPPQTRGQLQAALKRIRQKNHS